MHQGILDFFYPYTADNSFDFRGSRINLRSLLKKGFEIFLCRNLIFQPLFIIACEPANNGIYLLFCFLFFLCFLKVKGIDLGKAHFKNILPHFAVHLRIFKDFPIHFPHIPGSPGKYRPDTIWGSEPLDFPAVPG